MRPIRLLFSAIIAALATLLLFSYQPSSAAPIPGLPDEQIIELPQAGPDLVIDSVIFSPANPAISQTVQITVTFSNQGDTAASGFYVYLFVDPADQPPITSTAYTSRLGWFVPLNPSASQKWTRTQTFATNGNHVVYAWIDRDGSVAESNESNNLVGPITIPVGTVIGDPFEDDNTCGQAKTIQTNGTPQTHDLNPAPDQDWVKFEGMSGVTYRIQGIPIGQNADLAVELHNSCNSLPSFGGGTEFDYTVPADGTYYLKFEHVQTTYGSDNSYQVKVTAQNVSCSGSIEPNNICSAASDIAANGVVQQQSFCEPDDVDWVRFNTVAGATYSISSTNVGANADVELGLFPDCDALGALGTSQQIQYTAPSAGSVYLRAQNTNPAVAGPGTEYTLQVTQLGGGCQADTYEDDDFSNSAHVLATNGVTQTHNACPASDVDWYEFQATAGVSYTLETLNLGRKADTVLYLYDSTGATELAHDDDSGAGRGSRLFWTAPTSGLFKVRVIDHDPAVAGPDTHYDIRVFTGLCLPDNLEPDNTRAAASLVTMGGRQPHNICPGADEDWMSFTASAAPHVIETTDLGPDADTILELFDANGLRLAENDDFSAPADSRIAYTFTVPGAYFVRVQHYSPNRYGAGTEYSLHVYTGTPTPPTATPTPPPTVTPTPTPPPQGIRTIILVNRERIAAQYGEPAATQLMTKVNSLAAHTQVRGEVIRLDNNATISAAYAAWAVDLTSVDKANQVTAAIRGLILTYLQEHGGVEYIVLVGDDQAIPLRRIPDNTPRTDFLERDYTSVSTNNPTGAALRGNNYLTDDYYADREPTVFSGRELYLPDLAIGRLIETPDEIGSFIDTFLSGSYTTTVTNTLVTGYDFVQDAGNAICSTWQSDQAGTGGNVDCSLIGSSWPLNDLRNKQLSANPPFKVQSINGHADHYREGAAGGGTLTAAEIVSATADLARGLLYTMGCHSGLNVPATNAVGALDLAQAFNRKGMNYVGNTGYGWGLWGNIGLSERLMQIYTEELQRGDSASMGKALAAAKRRYYQEEQTFNGYDEKILEESVFYGLPMYMLKTGNTGSLGDDFPSVQVIGGLPGTLGGTGTFDIELMGALGPGDIMSQTVTSEGSYYALDGSIQASPNEPVQPRFFMNVTAPTTDTARSVLFRAGHYTTVENFDPVIAALDNEFVAGDTEPAFTAASGWYPAVPANLQINGRNANLVTQLGQFDPATGQERLYSGQVVDVYYSSSLDRTPPTVTVMQTQANIVNGVIAAKVGAEDVSGVESVLVTYQKDLGQGQGQWLSVDLTFNPVTQKWTGTFPGTGNTRFFVQAVDGAGNLTAETNKGLYYAADVVVRHMVYLPLTMK